MSLNHILYNSRNASENPAGIETCQRNLLQEHGLSRNASENPAGIETLMVFTLFWRLCIVATHQKTQQGLKLEAYAEITVRRLGRNASENPAGIETAWDQIMIPLKTLKEMVEAQ